MLELDFWMLEIYLPGSKQFIAYCAAAAMEDYDMAGAPGDYILLPASPVQLLECPVDPFLERPAVAGFVAAGEGFGATLDEAGACGNIQRYPPMLPSESMEKDTLEDGNFEVVEDDVGSLPGVRCIWHGAMARDLPPRPPSRAGMAGDFLIFDEQEGDGGDDGGLGMGLEMGRAGGLGDEEDEYEQPTRRGRSRGQYVLSGNAYASPTSPIPRGPRTRSRASIHNHRGRALGTYISAALQRGEKGTNCEIEVSLLSTFPPLPLPASVPPSSPVTPPPKTKRPRDTGGNEVRWHELALDDYDIPSPPTTASISSSSTFENSSHYAHSSNDKEKNFSHQSSPISYYGRDGNYPDADPMDISPPPSPELPRPRASPRTLSPLPVEPDSGSSAATSSSPSSSPSSSDIDTTSSSSSSSSSGDSTSEDDDSRRRVSPSTSLHHPSHSQPHTLTCFTYLKSPSLRSIHSSTATSIKQDCTSLIKEALLPQITSSTSANHSSIFTTSLHFQRHLRTCFTSFTGNLTAWKSALENALHASPPKGRITLPGYLTLVPSYPHLILELNIRLNNTSNSTFTTKPSRPHLPAPSPQTPIYAFCKLVLAELTIAAYLAEMEMYSRTLALPVHSKSADLVRQKLLRRVSREARSLRGGGRREAMISKLGSGGNFFFLQAVNFGISLLS
ncbi:hypothetical protein L211DRAFT_511189 [Terfezia boudieri ATCC MYA-4762]|uniref:Uncharacterized protein n=1 Tax=Terfezia boudieri ATCC MYA-4762 TaxID=1051890 RepID=A0A3N4LJ08_9PEZI|nr:hypothetical protein L211DRAFT_511189 [Terfezia boudieri ATCC MYA-4762]